jgi:hypothetical protein
MFRDRISVRMPRSTGQNDQREQALTEAFSLYDWYVVVKDSFVVDLWPITARGAVFSWRVP